MRQALKIIIFIIFALAVLTVAKEVLAFPPPGAAMHFTPSYIVNILTDGNGTTNLTGPLILEKGESVSIEAVPGVGSELDNWNSCDSWVDNTCNITNISANRTVTAYFKIQTFTVTATPNGSGTIFPATPKTVNYNDSLTLTAEPDSGSRFGKWSGYTDSTNAIITLMNIQQDINLTAHFDLVSTPTRSIKTIISWDEKGEIKTTEFSTFLYAK